VTLDHFENSEQAAFIAAIRSKTPYLSNVQARRSRAAASERNGVERKNGPSPMPKVI
jgi:hypothetical protein